MYCTDLLCAELQPCPIHAIKDLPRAEAKTLQTRVTVPLFKSFLELMTQKLESEECKQLLLKAGFQTGASAEKAADLVETKLTEMYEAVWVSLGMTGKAGLKAQVQPAILFDLSNDHFNEEESELLQRLSAFTDLEADSVRAASLGPAAYQKAKKREADIEHKMKLAQEDLTKKLQACTSPDEQQKQIESIITQARAIGQKLQAMGSKQARAYEENMPSAEQLVMNQVQILKKISATGHSHGILSCDAHH